MSKPKAEKLKKNRSTWSSQFTFMMASIGSAVGLANIWKFPYMAGKFGGGGFILIFLLFLALVGIPTQLAEVHIGQESKTNPAHAFFKLSKKILWKFLGKMVLLTAFVISAYYSSVAAWILGYFYHACIGSLHTLSTSEETQSFFESQLSNPYWTVGFHGLFMLLASLSLFSGVRKGLERVSNVLMPLFALVLIYLCYQGILLAGGLGSISFLWQIRTDQISAYAFLAALGHAFFTLSLGQGTMITYGSYLPKRQSLLGLCFPIALADTLVSILSCVMIFAIASSVNLVPDSGPSLIFQTLPLAFSRLFMGEVLAFFFFGLVVIAALTSQLSVLEPQISYLEDKGWSRHRAVITVGLGAFTLGLLPALGNGFFAWDALSYFDLIATALLIPLGGLYSVYFVAWVAAELKPKQICASPLLASYFCFCLKYVSPFLIVIVLINALYRG